MDLLTLSLLLIAVLWLLYAWKCLKEQGLNRPPSPPGLPLIGHLHLLRPQPHQALHALSQKYGPVMLLQLGATPSVVISNASMAKEVLKTQDPIFASRPYLVVTEFAFKFKNVATLPSGEHWKEMRRLCSNELFTVRSMDSFQWIRSEEFGDMLTAMLNFHEGKRRIRIRELVGAFSFNIITRMLMSKRFFRYDEEKLDGEAKEFYDVEHKILQEILEFHVSDFYPFLRWIDWTIPRVKKLHSSQKKFLENIIQEHRASQDIDDFMSILLKQCDEDTVRAMIMELIQGGTDTSTTTIEFTIAELLRRSDVMKKAQEEIEAVVGRDRMVNESDLSRLEYMQAIVKEVMRLHPPLPVLPHLATQACQLSGYDIPKGATTYVNVYAIGRDPASWERPNEFVPERFVGKSINVKGQDFELIPFGSGRRMCPGIALGLKAVHMVVSNFVHGFDWSYVPGTEGFSMEEDAGFVTWLKRPVEAFASPRLSRNVYCM